MYGLGEQATLCFVVSLSCCRLSSTTATVTFQVLWKCRGHAGSWMRGGHGDDLTQCSAAHVVCAPHTRRRRFPDSLRTGDPWRTGKKKAGRLSVAPTPSASSSIQVFARPEGASSRRSTWLGSTVPTCRSKLRDANPWRRPATTAPAGVAERNQRRDSSSPAAPFGRWASRVAPASGGRCRSASRLAASSRPRHQTATSSRMRKMDTARIRSRSA